MIRIKCLQGWALGSMLVVGCLALAHGQNSNQEDSHPDDSNQDAKRIVQQAVKTELSANDSD